MLSTPAKQISMMRKLCANSTVSDQFHKLLDALECCEYDTDSFYAAVHAIELFANELDKIKFCADPESFLAQIEEKIITGELLGLTIEEFFFYINNSKYIKEENLEPLYALIKFHNTLNINA